MGIIAFIIIGLIAGLIARAILPGRQSMGLLATTLLGMVGSLVGGLVGSLFVRRWPPFRSAPVGHADVHASAPSSCSSWWEPPAGAASTPECDAAPHVPYRTEGVTRWASPDGSSTKEPRGLALFLPEHRDVLSCSTCRRCLEDAVVQVPEVRSCPAACRRVPHLRRRREQQPAAGRGVPSLLDKDIQIDRRSRTPESTPAVTGAAVPSFAELERAPAPAATPPGMMPARPPAPPQAHAAPQPPAPPAMQRPPPPPSQAAVPPAMRPAQRSPTPMPMPAAAAPPSMTPPQRLPVPAPMAAPPASPTPHAAPQGPTGVAVPSSASQAMMGNPDQPCPTRCPARLFRRWSPPRVP